MEAATPDLPGHDQGPALADVVAELRQVALVGQGEEPVLASGRGQAGATDPAQLGLGQGRGDLGVRHRPAPVAEDHGEGGGAARIPVLGDEGDGQIDRRGQGQDAEHADLSIKPSAEARFSASR